MHFRHFCRIRLLRPGLLVARLAPVWPTMRPCKRHVVATSTHRLVIGERVTEFGESLRRETDVSSCGCTGRARKDHRQHWSGPTHQLALHACGLFPLHVHNALGLLRVGTTPLEIKHREMATVHDCPAEFVRPTLVRACMRAAREDRRRSIRAWTLVQPERAVVASIGKVGGAHLCTATYPLDIVTGRPRKEEPMTFQRSRGHGLRSFPPLPLPHTGHTISRRLDP